MYRILYLRTVYWFGLKSGGSVGHTAGVINGLAKKTQVDIFSNEILPGVLSPIQLIPPFRSVFFPSSLLEIFYNVKVLVKFRKRVKYHLIYQRYSGYSFAGAWLAKSSKVPLVLEFNSSDLWKEKYWRPHYSGIKRLLGDIYRNLFKLPVVTLLENYNLKQANLIVVVSEPLRQDLVSKGVPAAKILVNPNGIDPNKYSPQVEGAEIRGQYGLEDKIVGGFIGTFGQWHGVLEMVRAIVLFYERNPAMIAGVRFLLIGDGLLYEQAKEIIVTSPFKELVVFVGSVPQEEGPRYLAACDFFLSPHIPNPDGSTFFGSPTKLFEYMGMGKAIIASDLGQIGEILEHRRTAYMVPAGDVEALAEAIHVIASDEALRVELGQRARQKVLEGYTWDKHVEKLLARLKLSAMQKY